MKLKLISLVVIPLLTGCQRLPVLSQEQLDVFNPRTLCGYIAHPDDQQDTWTHTTRDHCRMLQQEAIETWWDDTLIDMKAGAR